MHYANILLYYDYKIGEYRTILRWKVASGIEGSKFIMEVIGDILFINTYYTLLLVQCWNRSAQVGIY